MRPDRIASLVVATNALSADELAGRIDLKPDEVGSDSAGTFWEVQAVGSHEVALDDLIASVVRRGLPATTELLALVNDGATCVLRIVAYLSPNDAVGGAFVLDQATIGFLAEVGGLVDADLYADPDGRP